MVYDDYTFQNNEKEEYTMVHFEMKESISSDALKNIAPPKVNGTKGVILSGRVLIWLYRFLMHYYHPTKFIAAYDPRVGAIVVESHVLEQKVGNVIKVVMNE